MASNPSFHAMEDQTDEDFFDKLVDDDFGPTISDSVPKFMEGSDSDEAKAFANLSIDDATAGGGGEADRKNEEAEGKGEEDSVHVNTGLSGADAEESNALDSSNLLGSNTIIESHNEVIGTEVVSNPLVRQTMEEVVSTKSGVKQVGWSSFYADSLPNGNHDFGSDFFSEMEGSSEDFPGKSDENASLDNKGCERLNNSVSYEQNQDIAQSYGGSFEENANGQDLNNSQYWESMYPGWKYDASTGQWYQVDGYDTNSTSQNSVNANANAGNEWASVSDGKTELNYLQQTSKSVVGTVAETSTSETVSTWNQVSHETNNGYPEHMVFDPQYPGWYYDTLSQEWRTLESYTASVQTTSVQNHEQHKQNELAFGESYSQNSNNFYGGYEHGDKDGAQVYKSQGQHGSWDESYDGYNQQGLNMQQLDAVANTDAISNFDGNQLLHNSYTSNASMSNHVDPHQSFSSLGTTSSYESVSQGHMGANGHIGAQSFMPSGNFIQQFNQGNVKPNEQMKISNDYYGSQKAVHAAQQSFQCNQPSFQSNQQSFQSNQQFSYASNRGRSSAGRPSHALVTFGFGGKLIVMRDSNSNSLVNSSFGTQEPIGGSITVLNLMEVVLGNTNSASSFGGNTCNYFHALCQQSFPGPLVGGSVGSKELNKWIDERIAHCESADMDYRKVEILKLLLSLLKISCQHYGKLRSPFGTDASLKDSDSPEAAVAKLFASAKRNTHFGDYGSVSHCLQSLPSEAQIRATASEVQALLVSGRKREALLCAQEGQLWGPALVLASQLGDQFYVDTVKQMALRQLIAGSPLRTLCLLIAGQPADVFSTDATGSSGLSGAIQQPVQFGANGMLDDWEENLAVITANRTKDDELVIMHLGDCLWKDRSEITAAHICYLVAEANFESYSDSARMCLIGADHWKSPRTYASPEAIQRTELYEYSKVLGNSQFILPPFQPYKLIYAHMLAEVGKVTDSLKYCQAILKSLKTGRAPEVETWRQLVLSLEDRIRTHQQGGYTANLAPAKLVGKLLNFFDSTAHRVVGGLPPPVPSTSQGNLQSNDHYQSAMEPRVSASQSTMAMSSLMPSASMEPISDWAADGSKMTMHNRSVSEPDFGRTPRQVESSKEGTSSSAQSKTSGSAGASRFGRFGFGSQLLQKTVGLVLRPRSDRQAKLGEKNKFYYDEKLKRWVEEGAEPPAEETALPPPPTTSAFQNGMPDDNLKSALAVGSTATENPALKSPTTVEHYSGIPPIPTSSNQFSARGRMGVRARYVDTFNQGGGSSTKLFQSPSVPSVKPAVSANAKFFVPMPPPSSEALTETVAEDVQEITGFAETSPPAPAKETFQSNMNMQNVPTLSKIPMQRFPSMDNITRKESKINGNFSDSSQSRRTASWSGFSDLFSPPSRTIGEAPRTPSSLMPHSLAQMPSSSGSIGEDLHEVEL